MGIILRYINLFLTFVGLPLIVIFVIIGIIKLSTARGDKNKKKSGRYFLIGAIIILGVYILVIIITNIIIIQNFTGYSTLPIKIGP